MRTAIPPPSRPIGSTPVHACVERQRAAIGRVGGGGHVRHGPRGREWRHERGGRGEHPGGHEPRPLKVPLRGQDAGCVKPISH
jgi:hypothetical protein